MCMVKIKLYLFRTHFKILKQNPQNISPNSNLHLRKECAFTLSPSYITLYEFSSMEGRETPHFLSLSQVNAQDEKQGIVAPGNVQRLPVLNSYL